VERNRGHFSRGSGGRARHFTQEEADRPTMFFRQGKVREIHAGPCSGCSLAGTSLCPKQQGGDEASCSYVARAGER